MSAIQKMIRQSPPVDVTKPYDPSTVNDKTVVITGGAKGLGAHMVRRWASLGAHVVIGDLADAEGEELVASLRASYPTATFAYQHCDVTDWDSQVSLFETAVRVSPSGAIDIVVPNAGIIQPAQSKIFENPVLVDGKLPKPSTATLDVNITGATFTTHLALYYLPLNPRPDRCLLLIGSVASIMPLPGQTHYAMSKHAVLGLFRSLRATSYLRGIRVNMVAPFYTAQTHMMPPVTEAIFLSGSAGAATVADVVDAATRLVADEAVAGRSLVIGPRMKTRGVDGLEQEDMAVADGEGDGQGRGIWECYADDYEHVDSFVKRYLYLLNTVGNVRGWLGMLGDIWGIFRRK